MTRWRIPAPGKGSRGWRNTCLGFRFAGREPSIRASCCVTPGKLPGLRPEFYERVGPGCSTTAWPLVPCWTWVSARAACSSGKGVPTATPIVPAASSSPSRASRGPSGATYTSLISMPRSASGGSDVIVASRPPFVTAPSARAAPPGAALAARSTPRPPVSARTWPGQSGDRWSRTCAAPAAATRAGRRARRGGPGRRSERERAAPRQPRKAPHPGPVPRRWPRPQTTPPTRPARATAASGSSPGPRPRPRPPRRRSGWQRRPLPRQAPWAAAGRGPSRRSGRCRPSSPRRRSAPPAAPHRAATRLNHQDLAMTFHLPGGEARFAAKGLHGHDGAPGNTRKSEPPVNRLGSPI